MVFIFTTEWFWVYYFSVFLHVEILGGRLLVRHLGIFRYRAILYTQSCTVKSICCCCLVVSDIHIGTVGGVIVSNSTFSLLRWAILTSVLDQRRLTIMAFWFLSGGFLCLRWVILTSTLDHRQLIRCGVSRLFRSSDGFLCLRWTMLTSKLDSRWSALADGLVVGLLCLFKSTR